MHQALLLGMDRQDFAPLQLTPKGVIISSQDAAEEGSGKKGTSFQKGRGRKHHGVVQKRKDSFGFRRTFYGRSLGNSIIG